MSLLQGRQDSILCFSLVSFFLTSGKSLKAFIVLAYCKVVIVSSKPSDLRTNLKGDGLPII
jgi:hypothetical protein